MAEAAVPGIPLGPVVLEEPVAFPEVAEVLAQAASQLEVPVA